MTATRGEPDADALAELTGRRPLQKAAAVDPVLGLVRPAPRPPVPATRAERAAADELVAETEKLGLYETPAPATVKRVKMGGYYAHQADVDRARAAWAHTQLEEDGYASWSEFQLAAVMALAEKMEREHNGGAPWPALPPGKVKHSRRATD